MASGSFRVKSSLNLKPQASPPANPEVGDVYMNASGVLQRYNGSGWESASSTSAAETLTNKTFNDTSNVVLKGGNTAGASVVVGTNDNFDAILEANGAAKVTARPTNTANADVKLHGTAGVEIPIGTAAQRPSSPVAGTIRANSDSNEFEGYLNGTWQSVGGGVNELPLTNYVKSFATATVSPSFGTDLTWNSTVTSETSITVPSTSWRKSSGATALTLTLDTSASRLRGGSSYVTGGSFGANSDGSRFFQTPPFQLDVADRGKPLSISFDISGVGAANDWDVVVVRYNNAGAPQERIPVAGNASNATSVPSAQLPTGTSQFRGFFISASDDSYYVVRFRRLANATDIRLDTLYVGPQQQLSSAAVTDWQSFTPVFNNVTLGSGGSVYGNWRRVGDSMEVRCGFTLGTGGSLSAILGIGPTIAGYTIDTAKLPTPNHTVVGEITAYDETSVGGYVAQLRYVSARNQIETFAQLGSAFVDWNSSRPFTWGANDRADLEFRVPISNWSSNVTMAERAVEEYASNDGSGGTAAGAAYTTGTVRGIQGSTFPAVNSTTVDSVTTYDVVFSSVILPTDRIFIETTQDGGTTWTSDGGDLVLSTRNIQHTGAARVYYGMYIQTYPNNTTARVAFGNYGRITSGSSYGAAGFNWGGIAGNSSFRWRLRKVSGGAAVGYPISGANILNSDNSIAMNQSTGAWTLGPANGLSSSTSHSVNGVLTAGASSAITPTGVYDGVTYNWVRIPILLNANLFGTISQLYITRAITDNGSTPYNGCSIRISLTGLSAWFNHTNGSHTVEYSQHGGGAALLRAVAVRDEGAGGQAVYVQLLRGIQYTLSAPPIGRNAFNFSAINLNSSSPSSSVRCLFGTTYFQSTDNSNGVVARIINNTFVQTDDGTSRLTFEKTVNEEAGSGPTTHNLFTINSPSGNCRVFCKVTAMVACATVNNANEHYGTALYVHGGTSLTNTMFVVSGTTFNTFTSVGSLSWSGTTLRYTTNVGTWSFIKLRIELAVRDVTPDSIIPA